MAAKKKHQPGREEQEANLGNETPSEKRKSSLTYRIWEKHRPKTALKKVIQTRYKRTPPAGPPVAGFDIQHGGRVSPLAEVRSYAGTTQRNLSV